MGAIIEVSTTASGTVTPTTVLTDANGSLSSLVMDRAGNYYAIETSVVNGVSSDAVVEYLTGSSGTLVRRISGPATALAGPAALAVDANSNIAVGQASQSILYFNAAANGNVAPVRTISGSATGLGTVGQLELGAGQITALNYGSGSSQVVTFAAGANGNVAPAVLMSSIDGVLGMTADSAGDLYVTSTVATSLPSGAFASFTPSILEFAPGATVPMRMIAPPNDEVLMFGIQVDSSGNVYTVCVNLQWDTVTVQKFAAGATGGVSPVATLSAPEFNGTDGSLAVH